MRMPVRNTLELCKAGLAALLRMVLDVSLLSVFKAHLQPALAVSRYRPVYLRSGRRNRVRH
jgi:hypothetical protein